MSISVIPIQDQINLGSHIEQNLIMFQEALPDILQGKHLYDVDIKMFTETCICTATKVLDKINTLTLTYQDIDRFLHCVSGEVNEGFLVMYDLTHKVQE